METIRILNHLFLILLFTCYTVIGKSDVIISKLDIRYSDKSSSQICILYHSKGTHISTQENKTWYHLYDGVSMCNDTQLLDPSDYKRYKMPFVLTSQRGNCTFHEMIDNSLTAGASGVIVVFQDKQRVFAIKHGKDIKKSFLIYSITQNDYKKMKIKSGSLTDVEISPSGIAEFYSFPLSYILLLLLASFIVFCGGLLAGETYSSRQSQKLVAKQIRRSNIARDNNKTDIPERSSGDILSNSNNRQLETISSDEVANLPGDQSGVIITPKVAVLLLCISTVSLLLVFFFFKYLVVFYIISFALCSALSLFQMFDLLFLSRFYNNPTYRSYSTVINWTCGLALSSLSLWWGICRNEWYAWILLDLLATNMLIFALKSFVIPNFKVCVLLLMTFLIYDVFFVFISPLLFSGRNVMLDVATGENSGSTEKIPFTLEIPHMILNSQERCFSVSSSSLIGFGDIILPGTVICFLRIMDIRLEHKTSVYFITGMIGYVLGLGNTMISLYLMQSGQPAILFLAPCILASVYLIAIFKGEVKILHNPSNIKENSVNNSVSTVIANVNNLE